MDASKETAPIAARSQVLSDVVSLEAKTLVDDLTDKILQGIFSFLSFAHRARCESVCKRWRQVIYDTPRLQLPRENSPQHRKLGDATLSSILARRGSSCKTLFLDCSSKVTCASLSEVGQLCPNLETLELVCRTKEQLDSLVPLGTTCPNLKVLRIKNCSEDSKSFNEGLLAIAKNCKDLDTLHLSSLPTLSPDVLRAVNPHLQCLILNACGLTSEAMSSMSRRCHWLKELKLDYCDVSDETALFEFLRHFGETLKILHLRNLYFLPNVQWRDGLRELSNLEFLELHRCGRVDDTLMEVIANKCCKIQSLDIGSSEVTDVGLIALQDLPGLKHLRLSDGMSYGLELLVSKGVLEHLMIVQRFSVFEDVYHNLAARYPKLRVTTENVKDPSEH